jgi:demethylmenaquinone methyltransferase / 2-methoxy-6-polyprenyl-1,4-benzoquinol methylase
MNMTEIPQSGAPQPEKVKSMFAKVANQYDKANSVLSLGIHHLWRKQAVQWSGAKSGQAVLDCATGTGDLAIEFKRAVGSAGSVIGTDFCAEMLDSAPQKASALNLPIKFELADVTQLQYSDKQFDICSISFGIRNVHDPVLALKEMARVTKPGGQVIVIEFGQMRMPVVNSLYNFYSKKILPKIGGWVTGQPDAYSYLQESSAQFPCREKYSMESVYSSG